MKFNSNYYDNFKPTEIRLLPLSNKVEDALPDMDIFEIQQKYILGELKNQKNGAFLYLNQGINAKIRSLVLFQCKAYIIGMGVIEDVIKYKEKKDGKYSGEIRFIPESLVVFYPLDLEELNKFWPDLKGFSRAKQHLDENNFYPFYLYLQTRHLFY